MNSGSTKSSGHSEETNSIDLKKLKSNTERAQSPITASSPCFPKDERLVITLDDDEDEQGADVDHGKDGEQDEGLVGRKRGYILKERESPD